MENEKMNGQSTKSKSESDSSEKVKEVDQVELKDQTDEPEATTEQEATDEPEATPEFETPPEPEATKDYTDQSTSESGENAGSYYQKIRQKAEEFVLQPDWAFVSNELANLALKISEGPEPDSEDAKQAIAAFQLLRDEFEGRKKMHFEELNQKRADNLERKKKILKQLSDLVEAQNWTATKEIRTIQQQWEQIKLLPASEVDALNKRFDTLIEEFENHKVDR